MTQVRKKVISLLEESPSASLKEVCYYAGTTRQTLDKMEEAGIISYYGRQIFRSPYADRHQEEQIDSGVTLEPSQQMALDTLWHLWEKKEEGSYPTALLYGVTGSGKSQVYLKLIEQVREKGKALLFWFRKSL